MHWVASLNDLGLIVQLEEMAKSHRDSVSWDNLPQHVKEGIQRGHQDYLEGRVQSSEEALKKIRQRVGY